MIASCMFPMFPEVRPQNYVMMPEVTPTELGERRLQ